MSRVRFRLDWILPAPRGLPQVEATFDSEADGILNVSASDNATNREQHITITGRSGLSQEEIERAVRDAEENAEEDQKRREAVETRNAADSSVFAAEKLLVEQGENVPAEAKTEVDAIIVQLKELLADEEPSSQDRCLQRNRGSGTTMKRRIPDRLRGRRAEIPGESCPESVSCHFRPDECIPE